MNGGVVKTPSQVSVRRIGEITIIDIFGSLTADSRKNVVDAYDEVTEQNAGRILLNMDGKGMVSSAGFGVIVGLIRRSQKNGQIIRLAQPAKHIRKMLSILGLTVTIEVFESEEKALVAF